MKGWDLKYIQQLKDNGKIRDYRIIGTKKPQDQHKKATKKSKYGNEKVTVNGIDFDSRKEANRYKELLLLLKAGAIGLLQLQVPFELNAGGTHSLRYIADFVYVDGLTGETIVEDVKGFKTREYLKKKRLMKKIHGIKIKEICN